jgi:hypothetical protein
MAAALALAALCGPAFAEVLHFADRPDARDVAYIHDTLGLGPDIDQERMADGSSPIAVAKPDLNGDGKPDYVVMFRAPLWGGSRGQRLDVFLSQGERYVPVLNALAVTVETGGVTLGVRDLIINGNVISWNGRGYGPR